MGHGIITRRGIDTSSATATSGKIVAPYTAFVNGEKITGGVVDYSGSAVAGTPYNVDGSGNFGVRIPNSGVYSQNEIIYAAASGVGINAEKIVDGHSILGVDGTQSLYEEDDLEVIDLTGYSLIGRSLGGNSAVNTSGYTKILVLGSSTVTNPTVYIVSSTESPSASNILFSYIGTTNFCIKFTPFPGNPYVRSNVGTDINVFGKN